MVYKHLFVLDAISDLNIKKDTSFLIMEALYNKGDKVFFMHPQDLTVMNKELISSKTSEYLGMESFIANSRNNVSEHTVLHNDNSKLNTFHAIHIRKDPPYDLYYHTMLLLLSLLDKPLLINSPKALLEMNEKISILAFKNWITETIISSNAKEILNFLKEQNEIVVKPLFQCSGKGITKLSYDCNESPRIIEDLLNTNNGKVLAQRYLNQIKEGETRVFLLGGKPLAVMKKIPKPDSFLANFDFGAQGIPYKLNDLELKLCEAIGYELLSKGIHVAALDIIDNFISEVNITSPGLLVESKLLYNMDFETNVAEYVHKLLKERF